MPKKPSRVTKLSHKCPKCSREYNSPSLAETCDRLCTGLFRRKRYSIGTPFYQVTSAKDAEKKRFLFLGKVVRVTVVSTNSDGYIKRHLMYALHIEGVKGDRIYTESELKMFSTVGEHDDLIRNLVGIA